MPSATFNHGIEVVAIDNSLTFNHGIQIVGAVEFSHGITVIDSVGSFLGTMTDSEWTATPYKQAGDTAIISDAAAGQPKHRYYTGSATIDAGREHEATESGRDNLIIAPMPSGYRVELGDPAHPIRFWNGTTTGFEVTGSGAVSAYTLTVTSGLINVFDSVGSSNPSLILDADQIRLTFQDGATGTGAAFFEWLSSALIGLDGGLHITDDLELDGALNHDGSTVGFYGVTPTTRQAITALTDSTGGTANDTVAAVSGSGADTTINNNFADLARKVNELITILETLGLAS